MSFQACSFISGLVYPRAHGIKRNANRHVCSFFRLDGACVAGRLLVRSRHTFKGVLGVQRLYTIGCLFVHRRGSMFEQQEQQKILRNLLRIRSPSVPGQHSVRCMHPGCCATLGLADTIGGRGSGAVCLPSAQHLGSRLGQGCACWHVECTDCCRWHVCPTCEVYDFIEVCAGSGRLSRVMGYAGFQTASFDIVYWDKYVNDIFRRRSTSGNNPLDMLSPAGMAMLI